MRKNFLTTGMVIALAWISLAPLSLLFVVSISSSPSPAQVKIATLLVTLFTWIFLSMGTGILWRRESRKYTTLTQKGNAKPILKRLPLETLQSMGENEFLTVCTRIFEKMWPGVTVEQVPIVTPSVSPEILLHRSGKSYLVHCENRKTFLDSREIKSFEQRVQAKKLAGGYFFTAGIFSSSAQKVSPGTIELIDGQKAVELVESLLTEKDLPVLPSKKCERRRAPRFPVASFSSEQRPVVEIESVYQKATKERPEILDISRVGMGIALSPPGELPNFFQLSLKLPSHSESIYILGEVIWQRFQAPMQTKRCGISFVSMTDKSRERLNAFLHGKEG